MRLSQYFQALDNMITILIGTQKSIQHKTKMGKQVNIKNKIEDRTANFSL